MQLLVLGVCRLRVAYTLHRIHVQGQWAVTIVRGVVDSINSAPSSWQEISQSVGGEISAALQLPCRAVFTSSLQETV